MAYLVLVIIGVLSAIIGALVGIGGGIIIVPSLVYFGIDHQLLSGMTPQKAIGTSSVILITTGLTATLGYLKTKQVDVKNGLIFLVGIIPGSLVGAYLSKYFTLDSFNLYFGLFLIIVSIILMIRNHVKPIKYFQQEKYLKSFIDQKGVHHRYGIPPVMAVVSAFVVGITTGLFGIGGGALMTPLMIIVFKFPPHVAVGTSMMMIFFSSLSSSVSHVIQGNVLWVHAIVLIVSSYFGAKIGVKVNSKMNSDTVVLVLRITLLILGIYLILKSVL
ncbi:sulfite exporter TauE/SafE family protein [Mammaliicoccus sp. Dog046]|uniref:sulfite exporter TauE/SafE family protein n=1 Tax=Mammaliicoccus sp. Dog046 TaxID=3034233 RepID=UPI002B25AD0C|nr:sulfite exporter TauE/SafE family protein [Mammaliicoccus sp. Dog046]WQK84903.1 sulfite exporter TauE/SafE family protein [Mammaliicoccus sp. Dog046]